MREVRGEVNRARRRLRRAYFEQRVREAEGDARASWEVLREVIGWGRGNRGGLWLFQEGRGGGDG